MNRKTPSIVGAAVGLALFLAIALLPALLYGGYAGVLLAGGIFGTPVQPTFFVRALIVFGMVMGATGIGSLFAVGGAVAGAAVGVLAETPARRAAAAVATKNVAHEVHCGPGARQVERPVRKGWPLRVSGAGSPCGSLCPVPGGRPSQPAARVVGAHP